MVEKLENLLDEIWRSGDRDEMSIKHIGHALAAIIAFDDWTKGDDYELPDYLQYEADRVKLRERITPIWEQIQQMKNEMGRADFTDLVEESKFGFYPMSYLESDWLSYAKQGESNV